MDDRDEAELLAYVALERADRVMERALGLARDADPRDGAAALDALSVAVLNRLLPPR